MEKQLRIGGFEVQSAIREGFHKILKKLFAHPYRVMHLAGHGVVEFPVKDEEVSPDETATQSDHQRPKPQTVTGMVLGQRLSDARNPRSDAYYTRACLC